jgi:GT2 family glycosyltransferase
MPQISILILTYNSINFIGPCLDSVFNQDFSDFEIIVIDNGSRDGTANFIENNYPQVKLVENKLNLGACKARNQGIEHASGDWIFTLDSDVVLKSGFLSEASRIIKFLPPDTGMIQPKILHTDKKTIYSAGIFLSRARRFFDIGKGKSDSGQLDKRRDIFGACSAAALYNRQMLRELKEDTGYFDERFFFLVEDVDLSWRAKRKGWGCVFSPEICCYHYGNSSDHSERIRRSLCFKNRLLMILKNEGIFGKIRLIPVFFFYDIPRWAFLICNKTEEKSRKEVSVGTITQPT